MQFFQSEACFYGHFKLTVKEPGSPLDDNNVDKQPQLLW